MKAPRDRITIRDVARLTGVGVGTVSRVLNDAKSVSTVTRERVLAAIRRLHFRPNAQARRLLRRRADTLCFVLSNRAFLHVFHAHIFNGVERAIEALRQNVVCVAIHYPPSLPPGDILLPSILEEHGWTDGLILAGAIYPNFIRRVKTLGIPFVVYGNNFAMRERQSFDQVRYDGFQGEFNATTYLIDRGHRSIVFVGDTTLPWTLELERGYLRAMRAYHLTPIEVTAHRPGSEVEYGEWAASEILSHRRRPTAVLAGNDPIAFGLWRSLRRQSIRVPEDISLVGFDDVNEALLVDPPLTTVRVPMEGIGEACVKQLTQRMEHPCDPFVCRVLPTELVLRGSVRTLATTTSNSVRTRKMKSYTPG